MAFGLGYPRVGSQLIVQFIIECVASDVRSDHPMRLAGGGTMTQRRQELAIIRVLGADSASLPETVFFEEMLAGWQSQRLSRNLSFATVEAGARV